MTAALLTLLILAVAAGAVALTIRRHQRRTRILSGEDRALIHVRWHEIEQSVQRGGPTQLRQAVIEADKLVDYSLKQLQVGGETMGERLRQGAARFSDYQGVWEAHKVRNQLVHEVNRELLSFETTGVLAKFKRGLHDLGAL